MLTPSPAPWTVRGVTFAIWALAAASVAYWALKLGGNPPSLSLPAPPARPVASADPGAIARLLGATPATAVAAAPVASLASRFQLVGVAAGAHSGAGAAVISVDGKPAKPYRVGSQVDEGVVLKSVHARQAVLVAANGGPMVTLELPAVRSGATAAPLVPMPTLPVLPQGVLPPQAPIAAPR